MPAFDAGMAVAHFEESPRCSYQTFRCASSLSQYGHSRGWIGILRHVCTEKGDNVPYSNPFSMLMWAAVSTNVLGASSFHNTAPHARAI